MTKSSTKTFCFGPDCMGNPNLTDQHPIGDPNCQEGSCDELPYPVPCVCGGLIHVNFVDEFSHDDDDYREFAYGCDQCGDKYEEKENP